MLDRVKVQNLSEFFSPLENRSSKGVYFYRINGYNQQVADFIRKYYEAARSAGVVIEGRIPNPDEKNLAYFNEIMGTDFQLSLGFLTSSLKKWLPRMSEYQRNVVATAMYDTLDDLRKNGKNENMLKNAYTKFMCWLYYKFERIVNQLGNSDVPKILYEGEISKYEFLLIRILAGAGCDVVLLQYKGDQSYLSLDPASLFSDELRLPLLGDFPAEFNLKWIREQKQETENNERLYGQKPTVANCTNAWIKGKGFSDFLTAIQKRGKDPKFFYNCYCRINGVEDKLTYLNELHQFRQEMKSYQRKIVIVDQVIEPPSMEEISQIKRNNYVRQDQLITDLAKNIQYPANMELQRIMVKAFVDVLLEASKKEGMSLNKLTNKAVYLLCWLKRYREQLFCNWAMPDISCFIYLGGCKNSNEALFMQLLARLPIDVLILNPDLNTKCCLEDTLLYEINHRDSMVVEKYPQENTSLHIATAAYHAERDLDNMMYQDSGVYRDKQYAKATSVTLQTMYEEIYILWNQELKYRPNFSTMDNTVNMPVIFAKVSGIKDGDVWPYWAKIRELLTQESFLICRSPFLKSTDPNPMKQYATEFFKNGKLQREKIKAHPSYQYGVLREEIQEHILDKLQILIDQKIIKGTFENGTEYTIVSTALNMDKLLVRMLQRFDFTKKNPKIVHINTREETLSLEDSILMAFLNLLGFDIIFFVPTGYQTVERYYTRKLVEEHQIGEYLYDLTVPNLDAIPATPRNSWRDKIFKRGT